MIKVKKEDCENCPHYAHGKCSDSCLNIVLEYRKLETENKRLREALEEIHKQSFKKKYWDIRDITNEALKEQSK